MKRIALLLFILAVAGRLGLCGQCVYINTESVNLEAQKESLNKSVNSLFLSVAKATSVTQLAETNKQNQQIYTYSSLSNNNSSIIAQTR